jgi:hypothetical protein
MTETDRDAVEKEFEDAVNMQPAALERWLESEDSRAVGWTHEGDQESVGHHSGRRIVEIKRKKKSELTEEDYAHMRKVVGYVHRHLAQKPSGDTSTSRWRYSLMNWGHDPSA